LQNHHRVSINTDEFFYKDPATDDRQHWHFIGDTPPMVAQWFEMSYSQLRFETNLAALPKLPMS
jgi:hypothetical protein